MQMTLQRPRQWKTPRRVSPLMLLPSASPGLMRVACHQTRVLLMATRRAVPRRMQRPLRFLPSTMRRVVAA